MLTLNEEANLPECIASLRNLDHELLVVDSGSTDHTIEIATAAGARVVEHPFENYSNQRNAAQTFLPENTEWVLHLDAGERLTAEAVDAVNTAVREASPDLAGYMLRRRTVFMGRWIKHGAQYPAYHMRLFRPQLGRCEERLYDQHFLVDGRTRKLKADIIDIVASDIETFSQRHVRWAQFDAREAMLKGPKRDQVRAKMFGTPIEKKRWLRERMLMRPPLFLRAFLLWIYRYFFRLGFLDGKEGLIYHFLQGCWFRFLADAFIYERKVKASSSSGETGA